MGDKYTNDEIKRKKLILEAKSLGLEESDIEDWMGRKDLRNIAYIRNREASIRRAEEIRAEHDKFLREMGEHRESVERKMKEFEITADYIRKQQEIYNEYFTGKNCKRQIRLDGYNVQLGKRL